MAQRRRLIKWPDQPANPQRQQLAIPVDMIRYMLVNFENPEVKRKLQMVCKIFFEKNRVLLAPLVDLFNGKLYLCEDPRCTVGVHVCDFHDYDFTKLDAQIIALDTFGAGAVGEYKEVNYSISDVLDVLHPSYMPTKVELYKGEPIKFDDFSYLVSNAKDIQISWVDIVDAKGNTVVFEELLEVMPKLENLVYGSYFDGRTIGSATFGALLQLNNFVECKSIKIIGLTPFVNPNDMLSFIESHPSINQKYHFYDAQKFKKAYRQQLDQVIDAVLSMENVKCIITYKKQDKEKKKQMKRIFKGIL